jgi:hypothetical protein
VCLPESRGVCRAVGFLLSPWTRGHKASAGAAVQARRKAVPVAPAPTPGFIPLAAGAEAEVAGGLGLGHDLKNWGCRRLISAHAGGAGRAPGRQ